ncbi:antirestriction protein ArdA [Acinetobacter bereziniae]|uniref:antirestriction protein ArdA n=1 Tax=Acinetobacter bereziniae TaxID=106648 RepID=UPI001901E19D|nr:antirestriction protein ArdA [Acinetobacter bereziniae]MBJ8445909.1 antirestriction protein ArdA [Acinetobacter bereziniae]
MNAIDFSNKAFDTTKNFRLEAFSFTFDFGLNIYFNDIDDLYEIVGDTEIEFWQVEGLREDTYMDVNNFKDLESAIELIMESHFQEDLDLFKQLHEEGYVKVLADAPEWHDKNNFCEDMNDYDFGHYLMHDVSCIEIPEALQGYINYEAYGRDALINDFVKIGNHIYSNH